MVETIQWTDAGVVMIDQTRLPRDECYVTCRTYEEMAEAIRTMVIRGAPAIGVAAAMGVALGVAKADARDLDAQFEKICATLASTRPTAVNLFWAIDRMKRVYTASRARPLDELRQRMIGEAQQVRLEDIAINQAIGRHGAPLVPDGKTVLTHCNAGALATAGYGTALGVIRAAVSAGKKIDVFADETRPFLQGSRLTVWELQQDGIPATLITDNMAGHFLKSGRIGCVVVGADRIAAQRRRGQQDRHLFAGRAGERERRSVLCGRADFNAGSDPRLGRRDPHRAARRLGSDPRVRSCSRARRNRRSESGLRRDPQSLRNRHHH